MKLFITIIISDKRIYSLLLVISGFITIYLTSSHYKLINNHVEYRESILIIYEFIFFILGFLFSMIVLFLALFSLFRKDLKSFAINILGFILGCLLLIFAMLLDSPTLIYMT